MYPKKFARTPVSIIKGPATAVSPPKKASNDFNGAGSLSINFKIPLTIFIKWVLIVKNCSPTPASSALSDSKALLYFPEADSVTIANSRPAMLAKS